MVVIKSNGQNWDGRDFTNTKTPKVYKDWHEASNALNSYWFYDQSTPQQEVEKNRDLDFRYYSSHQISEGAQNG